MNDKKAKQLRRMARNATVGMPERRLVWGEAADRLTVIARDSEEALAAHRKGSA